MGRERGRRGDHVLLHGAGGLIFLAWQRRGSLATPDYDASVEQAIVVRVEAWDINCPQHIPQLVDAKAVAAVLAERDARIAAPEAELRRYRP